jgi:hypothetical protein
MEKSNKLTRALKAASEEGIDLSQLYERLSLTPNRPALEEFPDGGGRRAIEKGRQEHRDRKRH